MTETDFDLMRYDTEQGYQSNFKAITLVCEQIVPRLREVADNDTKLALFDLLLQLNQTGRCLGGALNSNKALSVDVRNFKK